MLVLPSRWEALLQAAAGERPPIIRAHTFLKRYQTYSKAALLECDGGRAFIVKGRQAGRSIVNDQVVGKLGTAIGAPVGTVALIYLPDDLVSSEPELSDVRSGLSHGSEFIPRCTEREAIMHHEQTENRPRFAKLAMLYGWMQAGDHQFIYANSSPNLVYSVDHGHFFPGGPDWTVAGLNGAVPPSPDATIVGGCQLASGDVREAALSLQGVTDEVIASAVAAPPDEWGLAMQERVALADYIALRRDLLLTTLVPRSQ